MEQTHATKQGLLDAGIAMLLKHGYHDLGLQALLAETGTPKGSFYHHFQDKEDFALQVIDEYMKHVHAGLDGDMCQCPHWGFVLRGQLTTTDVIGAEETVKANDLFYWPPGHNVRVDADAEIVMFSPQNEHSHVIDHMIRKVKG